MEILALTLIWIGIFLLCNVIFTFFHEDKELRQAPLYLIKGLDIPLFFCYAPTIVATGIVFLIIGIRILLNFF